MVSMQRSPGEEKDNKWKKKSVASTTTTSFAHAAAAQCSSSPDQDKFHDVSADFGIANGRVPQTLALLSTSVLFRSLSLRITLISARETASEKSSWRWVLSPLYSIRSDCMYSSEQYDIGTEQYDIGTAKLQFTNVVLF